MNIPLIKDFLLWTFLMNLGLLLFWFLMILWARNWVYKIHSKFFKLSREQFDVIHYSGMGIYKISIYAFFLIPYLALCLATR